MTEQPTAEPTTTERSSTEPATAALTTADTTTDRRPTADATADRRPTADTTTDRRPTADTTADRRPTADTTADRRPTADTTTDRRPTADTTTDRRPTADTTADRRPTAEHALREIELSAGTIEYLDSGGDGPTLLLLHGLLMDGSLWHEVVADLAVDHRCIVPTLPLGAHRRAMRADADLSLRGITELVVELLERLELHDVTVAGTDTGGALVQLLAADGATRVGRIVLVSCDAFDNFPPGLTGRTLFATGKLSPRLFGMFMQQMRLRPVRRLPIAFGWLTRRGDAVTRRWMEPILHQRQIRGDTVRVLRAAAADTGILIEAAAALPDFDRPALVVWASEDRVMPPDHGRRLAELLPQGRLVEISDSYTLVPLDQPLQLAQAIREFLPAPGGDHGV